LKYGIAFCSCNDVVQNQKDQNYCIAAATE